MLFMGEEFGAQSPFLFFCDFEKDLAAAVTAGRRNEFARFARFNDPDARKGIPDPNAEQTFASSRLDWRVIEQPDHQHWLAFYRRLIGLRQQHIVPRLSSACKIRSGYSAQEDHGLTVLWEFYDCSKLTLLANLGAAPLAAVTPPNSPILYASENIHEGQLKLCSMPPWSVVWFMEP